MFLYWTGSPWSWMISLWSIVNRIFSLTGLIVDNVLGAFLYLALVNLVWFGDKFLFSKGKCCCFFLSTYLFCSWAVTYKRIVIFSMTWSWRGFQTFYNACPFFCLGVVFLLVFLYVKLFIKNFRICWFKNYTIICRTMPPTFRL